MQTQYLTYRTLLAPVSGQGISEAEAKDILRQVLSHLSELHDRNQSHGSISLDTVAYDYRRMEIILLDANGKNHPTYLAPETSQSQLATPTADIYALGVVIISLLTGFPPEVLKGENDIWNWQEICTVSDQFIKILDIALFPEPKFRYVSAGQMLRSLKSVTNLSESTITNHVDLLLPPTLNQNVLPKEVSPEAPLSSETHSLATLDLELSHKTKRFKVNSSNSQIYRKAKAAKNQARATSKGMIRVLLATLLVVGVTISGSVGAYFYMQSKSLNIAKKDLDFTNAANQSIDKVLMSNYEKEKTDDAIEKLIILAKDKYENSGDLSASKVMLQVIPFDNPSRPEADKLLAQWEKDIKKNNDLIPKIEKVTKDETLQAVISTFAGMSPKVWQSRGKATIEESPHNLINPDVAKPSQPVTFLAPNLDPPVNPEIYTSPTETYSPPQQVYIYSPPTESSTPLPPAPRVAK